MARSGSARETECSGLARETACSGLARRWAAQNLMLWPCLLRHLVHSAWRHRWEASASAQLADCLAPWEQSEPGPALSALD